MEYTSRAGRDRNEAHVNYKCPCGCVAGLIYDRESGTKHLGRCCCGRLLWVGSDAAAVVRTHQRAGMQYTIDVGSVTLPWGEAARTALAVPLVEGEHK